MPYAWHHGPRQFIRASRRSLCSLHGIFYFVKGIGPHPGVLIDVLSKEVMQIKEHKLINRFLRVI